MKTIFSILLVLVCMCVPASADTTTKKVVLQGRVTDAIDGQPVVGASIFFPLLKQGTVTNHEGLYEIKDLPAVKTTIQVTYVGHLTIIESIDLHTTTSNNKELSTRKCQQCQVEKSWVNLVGFAHIHYFKITNHLSTQLVTFYRRYT